MRNHTRHVLRKERSGDEGKGSGVQLTIKTNFPQVQRAIENIGKQARYATAVALTRTAKDVREELKRQMTRDLDRPTPYTLNSLFLKPATRDKLEAVVWVKDDRATSKAGTPAVNYLLPNIEGGERHTKRFERVLQMAGHLPKGWSVVPGQGAQVDAYGNLSRGQIIQVLSQLRITPTAGYTRNLGFGARQQITAQRKAGGRFFVMKPGGAVAPGVYQREFGGRNITPVMIFVRGVGYRKRFRFFETAQRVIAGNFPRHFDAELRRALQTAR